MRLMHIFAAVAHEALPGVQLVAIQGLAHHAAAGGLHPLCPAKVLLDGCCDPARGLGVHTQDTLQMQVGHSAPPLQCKHACSGHTALQLKNQEVQASITAEQTLLQCWNRRQLQTATPGTL